MPEGLLNSKSQEGDNTGVVRVLCLSLSHTCSWHLTCSKGQRAMVWRKPAQLPARKVFQSCLAVGFRA